MKHLPKDCESFEQTSWEFNLQSIDDRLFVVSGNRVILYPTATLIETWNY